MSKGVFLWLILILFISGQSEASFLRPERESQRYFFGKSGEITWKYESITLKGEKPFSYLSQNYSLNLWGPFIFPTIGGLAANLNYRLGKNVLGLSWLSKTEQKLYTYQISSYLAPPVINRFLRVTSTLSRTIRDQFADSRVVTNSYFIENQTINVNFYAPWVINLGNIFGKNNNRSFRQGRRRRSSGFLLSLPRFNYVYFKSRTSDELYGEAKFKRESLNERYLTVWDFHNLSLTYDVAKGKEQDILKNSLLNQGLTRNLYGTLRFGSFLRVFQNLTFRGRYSAYERDYPPVSPIVNGEFSTQLDSKSFSFLGINSAASYSNIFPWRKDIGIENTQHRLSLASYKYLGRFYLTNTLAYGMTTSKSAPAGHSLGERFTSYYKPWRPLTISAGLRETYNWNSEKTRSDETNARIDFHPFSFLTSYSQIRMGKTTDLLKKEVRGKSASLESSVALASRFSPLFFLNNNNRNGRNGNNYNGFSKFLSINYSLDLRENRDLINNSVSHRFAQRYNAHSEPFNEYLVVDMTYERIMMLGEKPSVISDYFTLDVTSRAGLFYVWRGLTFKIGIQAYNFRSMSVDFTAQYKIGATSLDFNYRIVASSGSGPYRALGLSLTRKI